MKTILIGVLLTAMAAACLADEKSRAARADTAIYGSYYVLQTAMQNGVGHVAALHVTRDTIDIRERARKLALDSSSTDFESIPQLEVFLAFQLRWLLDAKTLASMDGLDVFVWGVDTGLVRKDVVRGFTLDKVQVDESKAMASILNQGRPVTDAIFRFELDDGIWKLDLASLLNASEVFFESLRSQSGKSKIEIVVYFLEKTYKQEIPPQILNGPLR